MLLADLGMLTLNEVTLPDAPEYPFPMAAKPTPLQVKGFSLLGVDAGRFVASKLAGRLRCVRLTLSKTVGESPTGRKG